MVLLAVCSFFHQKKVEEMFILISVCKYVNTNMKFNRVCSNLYLKDLTDILQNIIYLLYRTYYIDCCKQHFSVEWRGICFCCCGLSNLYKRLFFLWQEHSNNWHDNACYRDTFHITSAWSLHNHVLLTWGRCILIWRNGINNLHVQFIAEVLSFL